MLDILPHQVGRNANRGDAFDVYAVELVEGQEVVEIESLSETV